MIRGTKVDHVITAHDSDQLRPTLKTIAFETGLAIATVSRALKDAPDIGMATKLRVKEAAERLGYRPNRAGVRLRTGKTNVIALVLSAESDVMNHTSRLIYSIANALRGTAYHLIVMPFFPDQDPIDPVRYIVETESADAIILNQTRPNDSRVRYMHDRGFPFATHGRTAMDFEHPYFDFDNDAYARLAVRTLVEAGRKRLLLVPPPVMHAYSLHSIQGFVSACNELGVAYDIEKEFDSDSASAAIEKIVESRLKTGMEFDGYVASSTTASIALVMALERAGKVVGQDFDLVAKEAIPFLRRFRSAIRVIEEDVGTAGDFLAHAALAAIHDPKGAAKQGLETPVVVDQPGRIRKSE